MESCGLFWVIFTLLTVTPTLVLGGYPCLCSYQPETMVFQARSNLSKVLGYLYEFDCKPTYPLGDATNSDFVVVQFGGQLGYIQNVPGALSIEACLGTIPLTDQVLNTTSISTASPLTSTPGPSTGSTPDTTPTSTNSAAPDTTQHMTQQSTTLQPTTSSTTLPPTTSSTTLPPTTSSTTLPPTTSSTTLSPTASSTTLSPTTSSTTLSPTTSSTTLSPTTSSTTLSPTTKSTTTSAPTTPQPGCPQNWFPYSTSCYLVNKLAKPVDEATAICRQYHSHLVNIQTKQEQDAITRHLNQHHASDVGKHYWTGGWCQDRHQCGWISTVPHQTIPMTYTHWDRNQPNNSGKGCLCLQGSNAIWKDKHCDNSYYFICERSM